MSSRAALALAAGTAAALLAAAPALAQNGPPAPECAGQLLPLLDACQKSVDLFAYLAPQLGALVAGGNIELGRGGTTGGPGHFSIGVRGNALRSPVPQVQELTISPLGAVRSRVGTENAWVGFPVVDAAVGVFGGVPVGVTAVGGLDLLVSAAYVPNVTQERVAIRTDGGALRLGVGARLGLLRETFLVPGVSVSVLRRSLPTTSVRAATDRGDVFGVRGARVRADSWRLTASKNLILVAVAAGVGQDRYNSAADLEAAVDLPIVGAVDVVRGVGVRQRLTRTNYFANLTLVNLPFARLVAEVGRTQGGSARATYNSFGGRRPDQGYTYGSVGVRVGR
jgi:hypothetical protein